MQVHTWPHGLSQFRGLKVHLPSLHSWLTSHVYPHVKNTTVQTTTG